jgi:uncharacterized membrane protein
MRKAVVTIDAGFEAVLATILLMGVVYAVIDGDDFPTPASDVVIALFAVALYALALVLATLVKNERLTDRVLSGLSALNAAFALLLVGWRIGAGGFSKTGTAVVWTTAAVLLALSLSQATAVRRR